MRSTALLCLFLNACGGGSPAEIEPAAAGALSQRAWMRAHFAEGAAIRDAVVQGQHEHARAGLARLAAEPDPRDAPAAWRPHLAALRAVAQRGARTTDLEQAGAVVGSMAVVCGDCHAAVDARVPVAPEPEGEEVPEPMRRHHFAAQRMWEGLVVPSPAHFVDGARVLAAAPLHPLELVVGDAPPLEVVHTAERVRDLAGRASRADTAQERGQRYGELLARCAGCHTQQ